MAYFTVDRELVDPDFHDGVVRSFQDDLPLQTVIGRINTRTGEFTGIGSGKRFDLKGRPVRGSSNARGAYYNKNLKKSLTF